MSKGIKEGERAPDFSLPSHQGGEVTLNELLGKGPVVLFFYPKDNSPGCKKEVCAFRDSYEVFRDERAEVTGSSSDPLESPEESATGFALQYPLLSDRDGKVRKSYGAYDLGGVPGRVTYIIDPEGIVRYVFSSQLHPTKHIDEALRIIKEMR
jgi:peroxiredoxin Q/BCP